MNREELILEYEKIKKIKGKDSFKFITYMLKEARKKHIKLYLESEKAIRMRANGEIPDPEQSWRSVKGAATEFLIQYIVEDQIPSIGLKIVNTKQLKKINLVSEEVSKIKRNLLVDFGEFGHHLPDVDLIIYNPKNLQVIAIISSKVTLRDRVAQTGYWKLKLRADSVTKDIKVYFFTLDEDGTLTKKNPAKKGRAIVETDTDGCYLFTESIIEQSEKVKGYDRFFDDIKKLKWN